MDMYGMDRSQRNGSNRYRYRESAFTDRLTSVLSVSALVSPPPPSMSPLKWSSLLSSQDERHTKSLKISVQSGGGKMVAAQSKVPFRVSVSPLRSPRLSWLLCFPLFVVIFQTDIILYLF